MKACFPIAHDRGLESRVYPHFGGAPMFLVVDTETKATRAVANPDWDRGRGPRWHPLDVVDEALDLVVVSDIGPGALDRLLRAGVRVYRTGRATAGEALEAVARGALPPVLPQVEDVEPGPWGRGWRRGHCHGRLHGGGPGPHRFRGGRWA